MARATPHPGRLPFVVVQRFTGFGELPRDTPTRRFATLAAAQKFARETTVGWLQLIGGQYPYLSWHVVDTRDGTAYFRWYTQEGTSINGSGQSTRTTLW